jgi:hypothetical protein
VARRAARAAAQEVFEAYAQDPEVARYMIWRPHRDVVAGMIEIRTRTQNPEPRTEPEHELRSENLEV